MSLHMYASRIRQTFSTRSHLVLVHDDSIIDPYTCMCDSAKADY